MSQSIRSTSSSSSIFHRHVARAFAPEFPTLFKLKLSFFICTERLKTKAAFSLNIEVNNKVDWHVMQFALSNFLNILTASSKLTQPTIASLASKTKHFYNHSKKTYFCLVTAKGIKFNFHNCVCILFQYFFAVSIATPTKLVKHVDTFAEANFTVILNLLFFKMAIVFYLCQPGIWKSEHTLSQGAQNSVPSPLRPPYKASIPRIEK